MARLPHCLVAALLLLSAAALAGAQARFDLAGPKIDIRVTRAGATLPISQVPNLQPGDQIWLHPDLPPTQSVHYLLIAAFLRGTTNPPPDSWFTRIETWQKGPREEGVQVTVPAEAQQAILFLAPETGGDFSTLRSAVKGRPGIFVRASQDLTEAGFEQARIETYLAQIKLVPPGDPVSLMEHSNLLARTLNLKPNPDCFKRTPDQQYTCLTQTGTQTLLDDGHAQSIVAALSQGPNSDFINQASTTQLAGAGTYSAYVGAIIDFARILNSVHTAQYQYIPAIASPSAESLNLRLNTPPSFHNPKSVIVIGMPAILPAQAPPLRPANPTHISCLLDPRMVLPIEGAPLVFSTAFAHDLVLHLNVPPGSLTANDLPLIPDAYQGGLVLGPPPSPRHELPNSQQPDAQLTPPNLTRLNKPAAPPATSAKPPADPITGTVRGSWGFDSFTGPTLALESSAGTQWHVVNNPNTSAELIAGQPNHLQITSTGTACIRSIHLQPSNSRLDWHLTAEAEKPAAGSALRSEKTPSQETASASKVPVATPLSDTAASPPILPTVFSPVDLTVNLQQANTPGTIQLSIQQFGQPGPDHLDTRTFALPAKIESLKLHAGDSTVQLTGVSLDQVKQLTLKNANFFPVPSPADSPDPNLTLALAADTRSPILKADEKISAEVTLQDGRTLTVAATVLPSRPSLTLLSRRVVASTPSAIQLASPDEVPLGAQLVFFLKSRANFPRAEQVEIANADESLQTRLSLKEGTLVLQDAHTLLATIDPLKLFGPSSFGPFRLRAIAPDGTAGDWIPLATIVRLPVLTSLGCPTSVKASPAIAQPHPVQSATVTQPPPACTLAGTALYLIDSISDTLAFNDPIHVPEGFVETTLSIPHPAGQVFYLRLHDDPAEIQQAILPIQQDSSLTAHTVHQTSKPPSQ